ncbi:MAG: UTP--glucose-1-phosphate uridylyltransferase, partial [Lachnospiraceae bacterium]
KDIEPIGILKLNEIESKKENYFNLGIQSIKEGKVGAVLLAGGQGTRLGFDKPKGTCNIGLTKDRYIFEFLIENLMDVVKKAEAWVPLFIMTSQKNNDDTISFFEEHKYFGYKKEYVFFFVQEMVPSVDYNGKIYMEEPWKISMSPNGNGGWFKSMKNSGVLSRAKDLGVEWLNVFAVDNVLQKIADPYFIGATISAGLSAGAKVVKKASPAEKVGVVCRENGRPSIVEYYELTQEMMD